LFIIGVIIVLLVMYRDLLSYGYLQAKGQFNILWNVRDVEEVLSDPATPKETIEKLELVARIRTFAMDSLGLQNSENYTTYFDQKGKPLLWIVTASQKYKLEPYTWSFPIVGTVPYKGFFDLERTRSLGKQLKEEGYDVYLREVGGWSTLGWFRDPILSEMLNRSTGDVANLIIHELTHSTIFVKDSITFNENLASFIGHQGALLFLQSNYGKNSKEYLNYVYSKEDSYRWSNHFVAAAKGLDSLYDKMALEQLDTAMRNQLKGKFIKQSISSIDTIGFRQPERYQQAFSDWTPNNAWFLSYVRYRGSNDILERLLDSEYSGDIRKMISDMKLKYPYL